MFNLNCIKVLKVNKEEIKRVNAMNCFKKGNVTTRDKVPQFSNLTT